VTKNNSTIPDFDPEQQQNQQYETTNESPKDETIKISPKEKVTKISPK